MNKKDCSFSVIMTVYDQARSLEERLPAFLTQEYGGDYDVIVVDESSADDTDDVLKLLKQEYKHLYTTFLPKPNRNIIRRRMALSIGVKASKNDWVIFTDIDHAPASAYWLGELSEAADSTTDALVGYFQKKGLRLKTFEDVSQAARLVEKAERKRRKSGRGRFMKYLCGRYDFIAVRRSKAYDILKYFDQDVSAARLLSLRMGILFHNCLS